MELNLDYLKDDVTRQVNRAIANLRDDINEAISTGIVVQDLDFKEKFEDAKERLELLEAFINGNQEV